MSEKSSVVTWSDESSKTVAMEAFADSMGSYDGVSKGNHRSFLDIETNKSVRPGFTHNDYYAFRPLEQIPGKKKEAIRMCMDAYDKVGIIRNIIDLMGDFGSQGINIVHENKSVEKFFKQWFRKVDGKERSERFLNNLYRAGQVFIYRSDAKITPAINKFLKSLASDVVVKIPTTKKNLIPWRYNFLNPLTIDLKDGNLNMMLGRRKFEVSSRTFVDNFQKEAVLTNAFDTLPTEIKNLMKKGAKTIPLDEDKLSAFYYKKDDWDQWANPITYAILDDIVMLEKMRLADLSALDGAISNIRLWTLGDFEHKILPTKAGVDKLRNVLASNVGGGTMELIWGPELKYTESNSQVYKFLGSEKYQSVLNSIYAGLGVPPTLTGMAGNGGGFTNNFISLKTLVERLQYGRDQLTKFWNHEIDIVRRSMGFRKPANIIFDQMTLSDEAAEKNLLLQLADRNIISHETILERFKEVPAVEKTRLNREIKSREEEKMPEKAGPFHNPNQKQDLEKMDKQHEFDVETKKIDIDAKPKPVNTTTKKPSSPNGRPLLKKDQTKRKKRVDTPKSKPGVAEMFVWAGKSFDTISDITNTAFLAISEKTNLRKLTKAEVVKLEEMKLQVLSNVELMSEVTPKVISSIIGSSKTMPIEFNNTIKSNNINTTEMSMEDYKKHVIAAFVEFVLGENS